MSNPDPFGDDKNEIIYRLHKQVETYFGWMFLFIIISCVLATGLFCYYYKSKSYKEELDRRDKVVLNTYGVRHAFDNDILGK